MLAFRKSCGILKQEANIGNQPTKKKDSNQMNDQLDPFADNGKDEMGAEWDAVRSMDGPSYGDDETDLILKFLKDEKI